MPQDGLVILCRSGKIICITDNLEQGECMCRLKNIEYDYVVTLDRAALDQMMETTFAQAFRKTERRRL